LIFAAIHGLDLIRNPHNSKLILLMISLTLNEENQSEKFTEITDDEDQDTAIKNPDGSQGSIHSKFTVAHVGSLDSANFFNANVGMSNALKEIENVRTRVKEKGGLGVATLLIRCGPIVQVKRPTFFYTSTVNRKHWPLIAKQNMNNVSPHFDP
jgi:hypothetical protein